jgi:primosomal replication protein N
LADNILENNVVYIAGKVVGEMEFSHEVYGEGFYRFLIEVPRLSKCSDIIPVTISERLLEKDGILTGKYIEIDGQFRSYNNYSESGNRLILTVFAREYRYLECENDIKNPNRIYLNGYLCKNPIYRSTPLGREIADILLAVNRPYNKSDYIPCIAWGRNARFSERLQIGDNLKVWGRIQSRQYQKKYENGKTVTKTAYEVSVSKMEVGNENNAIDKECEDLSQQSIL